MAQQTGPMILVHDESRDSFKFATAETLGYGGGKDMKESVEFLKEVFRKALERCTPGQKEEFESYLTEDRDLEMKMYPRQFRELVKMLEGFKPFSSDTARVS